MLALALTAPAGFIDDFNTPGNQLDLSAWTTEFGPASFLGRTQLRDWVHQSNIGPFVVANGLASLALNTFNPTSNNPGDSFFGTHAKTCYRSSLPRTSIYTLTVRMRLDSLQRGIVYGVYFYGYDPDTCATNHDELDIELLTNYLQPGMPLRVQLNR